jgi:hydrogenase nickel incorporation protein HypA/HybF
MHELGICEDVIHAVEGKAGGRKVARIRIGAGRLLAIDEESFQQSFVVATEGTPLAEARIELVEMPISFKCSQCGHEESALALPSSCTHCGGVELVLLGGDELILQEIEYESVG